MKQYGNNNLISESVGSLKYIIIFLSMLQPAVVVLSTPDNISNKNSEMRA